MGSPLVQWRLTCRLPCCRTLLPGCQGQCSLQHQLPLAKVTHGAARDRRSKVVQSRGRVYAFSEECKRDFGLGVACDQRAICGAADLAATTAY